MKGLGWTVLCICAHHLTRWLVRIASAETPSVELYIFLLQRPPCPYLPLFFQLHQKLKTLLCPFPTVHFPTNLLIMVGQEGVECTVLFLQPRAQSQYRTFLHILRLGSTGVLGKQNHLPSITRQSSGSENLAIW